MERSAGADFGALLEEWQIASPERVSLGASGERPGARLGSGLEFHDRRNYSAGDDLRRLDWRALARSDQVLIRLAREEIAPRLELLIDLSASMDVEPQKAELVRGLTALLASLARQAGWPAVVYGLGSPPRRLSLEVLASAAGPAHADFARELGFSPGPPVGDALRLVRPMLAAGALRIVVSDFLGGDPTRALGDLAGGASALVLIQVLGTEEARPEPGGHVRLVDAESGVESEIELDGRAVARYTQRLSALAAALAEGARRAGGLFVPLMADVSLASAARDHLGPAGVLEPA